MGFRFYKRINIMPGVSLNLSKSGPSLSIGPKGMKYSIGPKGTRTTFSIPGTGIYYTTSKPNKKNSSSNNNYRQPLPNAQSGFFSQLFMSGEEKKFSSGLTVFLQGDVITAKRNFLDSNSSDGYFMAGFISLGEGKHSEAEGYFNRCKAYISKLGQIASKIDNNLEILLEVTDYIEAPIKIDKRGLALCCAEAYQKQGKYEEALKVLEEIWNENSSDKIVCLSLIDLVSVDSKATAQILKEIIEITKDVENDTPIDTNILYLRSYALYRLNLVAPAVDELSKLIRKKKDRPEELMLDIRYLRGQMYEELGQQAKARKDYEFIFAQEPGYEDVAQKLNL
ncbi:DUF4236 domain-containing protein [Clostridium bovifaecis]|uniref:DUF4236 domain-containing protein n=1 Tax=Clostridium bovifaecis TaxID=2184719 RepID=A0A6I6EUI4_9CLOT|nr:DUF4236 domain-containing protein [Clostridium bovifaecis]